MNLTTMIALVRQDLHDEDSNNYRWTDAVISRHIHRALAELSESLPVACVAIMPTVIGSRELDISVLAGRILVMALEYPIGSIPPDYQQFSLWGDTLTITGGKQPDGNNCRIYYGGPHTIDASGSTLPDKYVDIIAGGACGYAAAELALYLVNRVNTGGAKTSAELAAFGNEKLKLFRQELKRLGRRNRVRVSGLSPAFSPPPDKNRDYGP